MSLNSFILLFIFSFHILNSAAKVSKFILPEVPPTQQQEYMTIVPKLYCNLRIGRVGDNLKEKTHLREQYQKLFYVQHPRMICWKQRWKKLAFIQVTQEWLSKRQRNLSHDFVRFQDTPLWHTIRYTIIAQVAKVRLTLRRILNQ